MTFEIFEGKQHLRILQTSNATLRNPSSSPAPSGCGIMASKMRSWINLKGSIHLYMMRMIGELNRTRRSQGWLPQWKARANQPQPLPPPVQGAAPAQAPVPAPSATSALPMKAAPSTRPAMSSNPGMANAPRNAPFPSEPSADPWSKHKPRNQRSVQTPAFEHVSLQP